MIVPDSSVWVEFFRATGSPPHLTLRKLLRTGGPVGTTEIVVLEVLAGVRSERERRVVRTQLLALPLLELRGIADYERASELYRALRQRGVTVRKLTDVLIALCVLDAGAALLHRDKDFDAIASATGLRVHPYDE